MKPRDEYAHLIRMHGVNPGRAMVVEILLDIRDLLAESSQGRVRIEMEPTIKPLTKREFKRALKVLQDLPKRMRSLRGDGGK